MSGIRLDRVEEVQMAGGARSGNALMTVGKILLWMDFLLLAFVYVGLRGGSDFWTWWVIIEGVTGLVLVEVGSRKRGSLTH
jgi:hypothetical protein